MGNEIVKYHNDMNKVNLGSFSTKELDLFFSICFKLKELGTKEITFSFSDLKFLVGEANNPKRVKIHIDNLNKKLAQLNYQFEVSPNVFERFVLFTNFTSDYNKNTLTIKVNDKFGYILNNLIGNFTKFELEQFVSLKSIYSKNLFKLLKQWDSKKYKEFRIEEFRSLLSVPKTYRMSEVDKFVLKPILEELSIYFSNFKIEKIKTGRSVTCLRFTWSRKKQEIQEVEKIEIEISEKLNKSVQKAKKNRFIEKLLNNDNIEILVNSFKENDLIKGLIWASKEIRRDISTLDYLIKTIKTGAEKPEKKIIIKKPIEEVINVSEEKNKFEVIEDDYKKEIQEVEKIKITQAEHEELYKQYLKENSILHSKVTKLAFNRSIESKYEIIEEEEVYQITVEEMKSIPMEELVGKRFEIVTNIDPTKKRYVILNEDFNKLEFEVTENIFSLDKIQPEKLLSKNGKPLTGGALLARLTKIAKEEKIKIDYNGKIII